MSKIVRVCIVPKTKRSINCYRVISVERGDYVTIQIGEQGMHFRKHVTEILSDQLLLEKLVPSDICLIAYIAGMAHAQSYPRDKISRFE